MNKTWFLEDLSVLVDFGWFQGEVKIGVSMLKNQVPGREHRSRAFGYNYLRDQCR